MPHKSPSPETMPGTELSITQGVPFPGGSAEQISAITEERPGRGAALRGMINGARGAAQEGWQNAHDIWNTIPPEGQAIIHAAGRGTLAGVADEFKRTREDQKPATLVGLVGAATRGAATGAKDVAIENGTLTPEQVRRAEQATRVVGAIIRARQSSHPTTV